MGDQLTIMGIHGLGDQRATNWERDWKDAIARSLPDAEGMEWEFIPFSYDDIFEKIELSFAESLSAVYRLGSSRIADWLFGPARSMVRGSKSSISDFLRWNAGYVVAWLEDDGFRRDVRRRLYRRFVEIRPDVVLAHSLGSLIGYDAISDSSALADRPALQRVLKKVRFVTFGSQLANPFVTRNLTNGRIVQLPVRHWFHLYNENDQVFTAPIRMPGTTNFSQVLTPFFGDDRWNHSAAAYLSATEAVTSLWTPLWWEHAGGERGRSMAASWTEAAVPSRSVRTPRKRAVLVGINDYPRPQDRLKGCVNDTFLMSEVLQECGIPASQIRVVLNDRATAKGILDRMAWLLDDAMPGDQLIFYYSGHGAQLASYGPEETVDRKNETLVPHDFDWSPETSIIDDQIYELYSQLPYQTRLVMIFDCCHSGGIHRDGAATIRGLSPPDDVRHRELEWDKGESMWRSRKLSQVPQSFAEDSETLANYCGAERCVHRLGRAMSLRDTSISATAFKKIKKSNPGRLGPYLPTILEACGESEYAFEYRHGSHSYGAFTYSIADILRRRKRLTFVELIALSQERLERLAYDQHPTILGPSSIINTRIPWRGR